ncbi:hypothetical protein ACOM2C_06635 [Pseudarthrobacter sp. So.54]
MTHLTRREQIRAITTAAQAGQTYCPRCGIPLNYNRGGLPNSSTYDTSTDTVTCSRCAEPRTSTRTTPSTRSQDTEPATPSFTG